MWILFRADFKYHPGHKETISGKATIWNLSEGGAFAEQIIAVSTKRGEAIKQSSVSGQELLFALSGVSVGKYAKKYGGSSSLDDLQIKEAVFKDTILN